MIKRFRLVIAALLMHIVFGTVFLWAWASVWPALLIWIFTGDDALYADVVAFGKAEDQASNSALFNGSPKETVSSHVGRIYAYTAESPVPLWVRAVKWITDKFQQDHVLKAIEEPFKDYPLYGRE